MLKRSLAVLLSLFMLVGVMSTTAFAAADIETLIAEYETKYGELKVANEAAQIADYEKILAAYDKNTGDNLPVETLAKLVNLAATYSEYVQGNVPEGSLSAQRAARKAINDYVSETIATAKMKETEVLVARIQTDYVKGNTTYKGETATPIARRALYVDFMNDFTGIEDKVKEYLYLFNMTNSVGSYDGYYAKGAPHGFFPASLVAAQARYWRDTELDGASDDATNAKAVLDTIGNLTADTSKILTADMKAVLKLSTELYASLESYATQTGDLSAAALAGLQAKVEGLSPLQKVFMQAMKGVRFSGTDANTCGLMGKLNNTNITPAAIYTIVSEANALADVITRMSHYDPNNTQIAKNMLYRDVREGVEALNGTTQSFAKIASFTELYNTIEGSFVADPNRPTPIVLPADNFTPTSVKYLIPSVSKWFTNGFINILDPIASCILKLVVGSPSKFLYTNEMVSTLAGLNGSIYDLLVEEVLKQGNENIVKDVMGALDETGSAPTVGAMAKHLSEPQFAEASAKFAAMESWADYDGSTFNWGFKDGDRAGFMKAAIAVLRPITGLIYNYAGVNDYVDSKYQDYTFGAYNTALVPLLEALDCRGIWDYDEYRAEVGKLAEATDTTYSKKQDALGYAIFNPLFNLVDDLFKTPVKVLLDLIPSLAYAQENGELDGLYQLEISFSFKALGIAETWVNVKIFELLGITNLDGIMSLLGGALGFDLPAFDWAALAHMGTPTQRYCAYIDRTKLNDVKADRADVFVTLLRSFF